MIIRIRTYNNKIYKIIQYFWAMNNTINGKMQNNNKSKFKLNKVQINIIKISFN